MGYPGQWDTRVVGIPGLVGYPGQSDTRVSGIPGSYRVRKTFVLNGLMGWLRHSVLCLLTLLTTVFSIQY